MNLLENPKLQKRTFLFFHKGWKIYRIAGDKYSFENDFKRKKHIVPSWKEGRDLIDQGKL